MNLRMIIPVEIAIVALLGAILFGYDAMRGSSDESTSRGEKTETAQSNGLPKVSTTRFTSTEGGFAVGVPEDVQATPGGPGVAMSTADSALLVVIAPVGDTDLAASRSGFIKGMKKKYTEVRVTKTQTQEVDGRQAKGTYGEAKNAEGVSIKFVNLVVPATPHAFAINGFTAASADPMFVLPRLNAIVDTFEVIE